jgi:6-phosphogluconolactonase
MSSSRGLWVLATPLLMLMSGCGGGSCDNCSPTTATHAISPTINGLAGSRLALSNSGTTVTIAPGLNGRVSNLFAGLASGASYEVTVATQPTTPSQTCVIANGTGTVTSSDVVDISVTCTTTPASYLLAQNTLGAKAYCITPAVMDSTSGALSAASGAPLCGSPKDPSGLFLPGLLGSLAVDPQGKFLYMTVPNGQIGYFAQLTMDHDSGAVSLLHVANVVEAGTVEMDPAGRFLFETSLSLGGGPGSIGSNKIDPASGALTFAGGMDFADSVPYSVTADPLGRYVFVAYSDATLNSTVVEALGLDSATGAPSHIAPPAAVTGGAGAIAIHPSGKFLYVASQQSSSVVAFNVDPKSGTLTPVPGSPFAVINGANTGDISDVAVDPSGNYLYVTDYSTSTIDAFAIDRNSGRLSAINGSPFPTGHAPVWVAIDPLGHFVYVSNDLGISAYAIDSANGALTPVSGSPFPFAFGGRIQFSY